MWVCRTLCGVEKKVKNEKVKMSNNRVFVVRHDIVGSFGQNRFFQWQPQKLLYFLGRNI